MSIAQLAFITMDVFTDRRFGGNPLAIFPNAAALSTEAMQQIAMEMNLSESVFIISRGDTPIPLIRIFTPKVELPFAGHPTVGTALFLAAQPDANGLSTLILETKSGLVQAEIFTSAEGLQHARITAPQPPRKGSAPSADVCSAFLSLPSSALAFDPIAYSAGVPYVLVPLKSRAHLAQAAPDLSIWTAQLKQCWASAVYALWMDDWESGRVVHARMFGPGVGILEDPATGSAAVALAGWLAEKQGLIDGEREWLIHQGDDMGRPSRLTIRAVVASGECVSVHVSGTAVTLTTGTMQLN
ncbi:PhzF family phenazine biosynthesis protein [Allopusillimonas ginsengisoli]|uniref:PhzF family phenazine biosynthesis protein n=1 Tax=Allopusillimonas ginsengisoli TaxID=453575 RepID=UPI00101EA4EB|nr:PhzF family phenazine biosynthesis protein [Allopusillimonas ginsengisoli]TEA78848.1 PhzF family phenazine biosynthesis protein [Allopusillimonas ginsengisoli]